MNWPSISALKSPDEVLIAVGLSDVKAEALRADLEESGAMVSVEEIGSSSRRTASPASDRRHS
jgi:hypothetical protein